MSYQVKLKVKEILEERKITQKKLAEVSGIRESTIRYCAWGPDGHKL